MNKKHLALFLASSLFFFGCAKTKMVKKGATDTDDTPKQEADADVEASIRGKDFTEVANLQTIFFDLDSSQIKGTAYDTLAKNADFLKAHPDMEIRVDGHTDERGTTEYNLALAQRRASAIRSYYKGLGIAAKRIGTLSWGEDKPACEEASEDCFSKNRRAETKVRLKEQNKKADSKGGSKDAGKTPAAKNKR